MGLRERLQTVTQFFQNAASKGHRLRQEEARGENRATAAGERTRQRDARHPGGMKAEARDREQAGQ
jgi:hypothetical protein